MSTFASPIERFRELGGELFMEDGLLRYTVPDTPEARDILEELRRDGGAIRAMLEDRQSKPPSLDEVKALLPVGVHLISYHPKQVPFAVTVASVVTNADKFFRAYLADLARRLENPKGYHCPPLSDILTKLSAAGLKLEEDV